MASVYIVKDKKTSDGRGLAYVKFSRAYEAAVALENCDPSQCYSFSLFLTSVILNGVCKNQGC